jgi:hypothetical protein
MIMKFFTVTLLVITCLTSCKSSSTKNKGSDEFYTDQGGFDYIRIPFIKPYEAIYTVGGKEWIMSLEQALFDMSVSGIKNARIINNNIIILYSTNTLLNASKAKESWYVIIVSKHIEKGFGTHQEFIKYLNQNGIKDEPKLFDMDKIYDYFKEHETIDWGAIQ